jgi:hypothetical protein
MVPTYFENACRECKLRSRFSSMLFLVIHFIKHDKKTENITNEEEIEEMIIN